MGHKLPRALVAVPRHQGHHRRPTTGRQQKRSSFGQRAEALRRQHPLAQKGLLPDDAEDLLLPDYDPAIKGFQRARGFFVPMEVVKLAEEWKALAEKEKGSKVS